MTNLTLELARKHALDRARAEAVRQVAGLQIQSQIFDIQAEISANRTSLQSMNLFASFVHSTAYGRVVQEEVLSEGVIPYEVLGGKAKHYIYRIRLRSQVALEKGKRDPSFSLSMNLNKKIFTVGEPLMITLSATKDCYVTLFDVLPNDTVLVLLPNERFRDNFLKAGETRIFPPRGVTFRTGLQPGTKASVEMILAVATRERIEFNSAGAKLIDGFQYIPTWKTALLE